MPPVFLCIWGLQSTRAGDEAWGTEFGAVATVFSKVAEVAACGLVVVFAATEVVLGFLGSSSPAAT